MKHYLSALALVTLLVACAAPTPPGKPPALTTPPDVATTGFLTAYAEQAFPMGVSDLRAFMEANPIIYDLEPVGDIATPEETGVLLGAWPSPGAMRWMRLSDGHYVLERVIENEPDFFKYQIFVFTNAAGRGIEQIVGEQRFIPTKHGTRFEWTYNVKPTNWLTRRIVARSMGDIQAFISKGLENHASRASGG